MGSRHDRGPAWPRGAGHLLVSLRRRAVAPRRRAAAVAGGGHEARVVVPHASEARGTARRADHGPDPRGGGAQRRGVLPRPAGGGGLGRSHGVPLVLALGRDRNHVVRGLSRPAAEERAERAGGGGRRGRARSLGSRRLRVLALPHTREAGRRLAEPGVERRPLGHDPEPGRLRQRQGRLHVVAVRRRRERRRPPGRARPRDLDAGGSRQRLPLAVGGGGRRLEARGAHPALRRAPSGSRRSTGSP